MGNSRSRYSNARSTKKVKKQKRVIQVLVILIVVLAIILVSRAFLKKEENNAIQTGSDAVEGQETVETGGDTEKGGPDEVETPSTPRDITVKLTAIGDVMCHNTQFQDAYDKENDIYNFEYVFESVKRYTRLADISVGNLETTFAGEDVRI